jgi:hypothetical protein
LTPLSISFPFHYSLTLTTENRGHTADHSQNFNQTPLKHRKMLYYKHSIWSLNQTHKYSEVNINRI